MEITERHIVAHSRGNALHFLKSSLFCFWYPALGEELPYLGKTFLSIGVYPVAQTSGPNGVLIELDELVGSVSEDHSAYPAVSHRERFVEVFGGTGVAEYCFGIHIFHSLLGYSQMLLIIIL